MINLLTVVMPPPPDPTLDRRETYFPKASAFTIAMKQLGDELTPIIPQINTAIAAADAAAGVAQASAAAALFNAATNYAVGQAAISGVNFMTYRNTLGGVNATDPANDTSGRWVNVGAPPVTVVDVNSNFTFQPGVLYRIVGSCDGTIPALAAIARGQVFSAINTSAAYAANILSNGHAVQGVVRDVSLDTDAVGRVLSLLYSGPVDGLVAI
jgi:hypothetical protein